MHLSLVMLPFTKIGNRGPLLILLHWLGGSGHTWHEVADTLALRGVQCVLMDLPGFGDANGTVGFHVGPMSAAVVETIQAIRRNSRDTPNTPWLIGGHSMGGKIASIVARNALEQKTELQNLRGMFLVSPSPPSPEPIEEKKRKQMLEQLGETSGSEREDHHRAAKFVDENVGKLPLQERTRLQAVNDVLRMNRTAFRAWLETGSKEDWSSPVGELPLPAMILAGSEEPQLGIEAQQKNMLQHLPQAALVELQGCGHLAPLERPFEVAEHATEFLSSLGLRLEAEGNALGPSFAALLESPRVSPQTRSVMQMRLASAETWNHTSTLTPEAFRTMRALVECVVPHAGFDIAAAVEERLTSGKGDGWRYATLPSDAEAWRKGLVSLDVAAQREFSVPFVAVHADDQSKMLRKAAAGELGKGALGFLHIGESADAFSAAEMKQWFEETRGEFTKCYMAHPATMERVGYTGFADNDGFTQIQIGQTEEFER